MNKKTIILILGLMGVSLIGILWFQAYWIQLSLKQKEAQLDREIQASLSDFAEQLEEKEALGFVSANKQVVLDSLTDTTSSEKQFEYYSEFRIESSDSIQGKNVKEKIELIGRKGFQGGMIIMDDRQKEVNTFKLSDSSMVKLNLIKRFQRKKSVLSDAIDQLAIEFAFRESSFADRMKAFSIDSLLRESLKKNGLAEVGYNFQLYDLDGDSLFEGKGEILPTGKHFEQKIFSQGMQKGGLLKLQIAEKSTYLLQTVWPVLLMSILLLLVLLLTFSFTIRSILRQKKLSQMKSDLINNMTHEFKTPIATISLALDSMFHPETAKQKGKVEEFGNIIRKENERMHQQVEQLLESALFEKGGIKFDLRPVKVHQLLDDIIEVYKHQPKEGKPVEIHKAFNAQNDLLMADRLHLYNALRNIVDNAVKFSGEKAIIRIESQQEQDWILIKICDQGIGMSASTQKQIFDSFYRYTEGNLHQSKGFGLGLAYVKQVLDRMDGEITVESKLRQGSCFHIKLKLAKNEVED